MWSSNQPQLIRYLSFNPSGTSISALADIASLWTVNFIIPFLAQSFISPAFVLILPVSIPPPPNCVGRLSKKLKSPNPSKYPAIEIS